MDRIRDNLYVGRWNDAKNSKALKGAGITAVLNVAADCSDPEYSPINIRHVKVGLTDSPYNKPYMVDLAVATLVAMLKQGETVLVHCMSGRSRAPHVACRALAQLDGKQYDDIWTELEKKRPQCAGRSKLYV